MAGLTDIASHRQLDAEVNGDVVTHISYRSNPDTGERRVRHEEQWRQGRLLGKGGYGLVWLQEKVSEKGKLRAVKMLSKNRTNTSNNNPLDEVLIMSILSTSSNEGLFVQFYGWYETHRNICLVMEYIKHGDLENYLFEHGALAESDVSVIVQQILEGLVVIHGGGFLHRDLKPSNILIQHISPWWVKIGDFGISRRLLDETAATFTGKGTSGFAAPEVAFSARTRHTNSVDIWSLGCVTYNSLTGKLPFENQLDVSRFRDDPSILDGQLDALDELSGDAKTFIKTLIVINPLQRVSASVALESAWLKTITSRNYVTASSQITESSPRLSKTLLPQTSSTNSEPIFTPKSSTRQTHELDMDFESNSADQEIRVGFQSLAIDKSTSAIDFDMINSIYNLPRIDQIAANRRLKNSKLVDADAILHFARQGDCHVVLLLLERVGITDVMDKEKITPLHEAALAGHEEVVRILLNRGALVNARDMRENTPLHYAVSSGNQEIVQMILRRDPSVAAAKNTHGTTPLHVATKRGFARIARMLLEQGQHIDVNAKDAIGYTPLHSAAEHGNVEIALLLLDRSADVEARNLSGFSPLHVAAILGHADVIQLLLQYGASIHSKTGKGRVPLHHAAIYGFEKIALMLLEHGHHLDVDTRDDHGNTALHYAAKNGSSKTVLLLIDHGADKNLRNHAKKTAYDVAGGREKETIKHLLKPRAGRNGLLDLIAKIKPATK